MRERDRDGQVHCVTQEMNKKTTITQRDNLSSRDKLTLLVEHFTRLGYIIL